MRSAIDFGITNTDAVTYANGKIYRWNLPSDGHLTMELVKTVLAAGEVELTALKDLAVTGGQHRNLPDKIGKCGITKVNEVTAIGRGGQALAGLTKETFETPILVVSAGSGTAVVAARGHTYTHITGTGVGGGTLLGLGRLLLNTADPKEIDALALQGDPNGADLSLADVVSGPIGNLPPDVTAVNFGRLARPGIQASREDLAAALVTLVGQVIAVTGINAARAQALERVVVTGHLIDMPSVREVLQRVSDIYHLNLILPKDAGYATALGALLHVAPDVES
ncbi:Fumble domain-containing protein [candidate division KSB1 bacterium]|nr:Fumble domain-containing protein [candidate division KSB1 bacterium]NIR68716.1 Fumble domain-containing protein [candidate division KSB1 bacterium]NIS25533.1 Fumble domain-containing protein [candidate division KSB1 bacterium]NIT72426.1 Fumble domain-containing protein [candidate division KSB1 bacterium]NIU26210.1 Fumble domain-containing protein [candidate division KSB1 bacterium]